MLRKTDHVLLTVLLALFTASAFAAGQSNSSTPYSTGFFDIAYLLDQFRQQIPQLVRFLVAVCYVSGFFLFAAGLMKLKASAASGHISYGEPIAYITVAVGLLFFPSTVDVMSATFMGPGGGDVPYSYPGSSVSGTGYASIMPSVVAVIKLVGIFAFMKGWLMLLKVGDSHHGKGAATKGVLCIIGGILAVNITTTSQLLKAALYYVW